MLEYGFRSKCCKAPIRMGTKKLTKTNETVKVWICCACKTKDVDIISKEDAKAESKPKNWWDDESDNGYDE